MNLRGYVIAIILAFGCSQLSACMSAPLNGEQVSSRLQPITFSGSWTAPRQTIQVQTATSRSGPFDHTIASPVTASTSSLTLYAWSAVATISDWNALGCGEYETFVRALGPRFPLVTFDDESISGESWVTCIGDRNREGNNILTSIALCQSAESPVVRLTTRETTYHGSVVITTQAEADAYACYRVIDGSLTIGDSEELSIALPNLERVTGDVQVVYPGVEGPAMDTIYDTRTVSLPLLTRIDGDLNLTIDLPGARLTRYDAGFEALSTLGRSLTFTATYGSGLDLHGLDALAHIPGDLTMLLNGGDFYLPGMRNLTSVGADVTVQSVNQQGVLNHLETIGGDLTVLSATERRGYIRYDSYTALRSIGARARLQHLQPHPTQLLPALEDVVGPLEVEDCTFVGEHAAELTIGATSGLSVGALTLIGNTSLADLSTAPIAVDPYGAITITDHPNLTQCEAQRFVDAQRDAGWIGTDTVVDNAPCP